MIKKCLCISTSLMLLLFAVICHAGDKYEEAREVFEQYLPAMEKYLDAVDKCSGPKELTIAINAFADSMEAIAPRMKKLEEKYPELKNEQTAPLEYADLEKKSEALGQRFGQSFSRIAPFMDDPEVQKANERLAGIMDTMDSE